MQQFEATIAQFLDGKPAITVALDATVLDAVKKMSTENSEYLLVLDDTRVVGIFTERDFLNRVVAQRLVPADTPLQEVMTTSPETLGPHDNIAYAVERMASREYRNIPIIDEGKPAAVLTIWDVMANLSTLLSEVEESELDLPDEWTDIGGG